MTEPKWRYDRRFRWAQARCPICHSLYSYPEGGYKPKTCGKFDCVHEYHHPKLYRKEVIIDKEEIAPQI